MARRYPDKTRFFVLPRRTSYNVLGILGIGGSGIDEAWIQAGMYSQQVVTKILNGSQYYRCVEAHTTTMLALYGAFVRIKLSTENQKIYKFSECLQKIYEDAVQDSEAQLTSKFDQFKEKINEAIISMESSKIFELLDVDKMKNPSAMLRFIGNYLKQFETILRFRYATRDRVPRPTSFTKYF